jgi:hypothetical protein
MTLGKGSNNSGHKLHKDRVAIHTEGNIKLLFVDGRQMTTDEFGDLEAGPLFTLQGELTGTPWGRVDYKKNIHRPQTDYNVLVQPGDSDHLMRCPIPSYFESDWGPGSGPIRTWPSWTKLSKEDIRWLASGCRSVESC